MTSYRQHYLMKQSLIIILRGWRRGHGLKGECHSEGRDSRRWHRKRIGRGRERGREREEKRSKAGLSLFMPQKAPKRIRNNRASGLLSSLAIRLSWWSEWDEWQGSRPFWDSHNRVCFSPSSPLSLSPLRVAQMQLKYFQMKTMWSKVPNLNHGGWWDWRGERKAGREGGKEGGERGCESRSGEQTHTFNSVHLCTLSTHPV